MKSLKQFWLWLDGKKTILATIYWTSGGAIIVTWFPEGLPHPWDKINITVGILLGAIGLGDKLRKKNNSFRREGGLK